jgi:hypothetical protein
MVNACSSDSPPFDDDEEGGVDDKEAGGSMTLACLGRGQVPISEDAQDIELVHNHLGRYFASKGNPQNKYSFLSKQIRHFGHVLCFLTISTTI